MAIKTSELVGYFASLATAHKKISHVENVSKHFYRMELNEFAAGTAMFNGYNLILEVMPIKYTAPSRDNLFHIHEHNQYLDYLQGDLRCVYCKHSQSMLREAQA